MANLDIHTSGGDIRLGNVGKRVDARTSGGDVIIGNVGGEARINTSDGDIEVGEVDGNVILNTAGGTIQLLSAKGEVRATTAGGDIELLGVTGSVEARTAGGDVMAELIPSGAGRRSLVTAGGDVTLYINKTPGPLLKPESRWKEIGTEIIEEVEGTTRSSMEFAQILRRNGMKKILNGEKFERIIYSITLQFGPSQKLIM